MSNYAKGQQFAEQVSKYLAEHGHIVSPEYGVNVGLNSARTKLHHFDFGNKSLIVECKRYQWTSGGYIPSAKIATLNEAMMYFHAASSNFRKMVFIAKTDKKGVRNPETFAEYYVRLHGHFIPDDVEFLEFDSKTRSARRIDP